MISFLGFFLFGVRFRVQVTESKKNLLKRFKTYSVSQAILGRNNRIVVSINKNGELNARVLHFALLKPQFFGEIEDSHTRQNTIIVGRFLLGVWTRAVGWLFLLAACAFEVSQLYRFISRWLGGERLEDTIGFAILSIVPAVLAILFVYICATYFAKLKEFDMNLISQVLSGSLDQGR